MAEVGVMNMSTRAVETPFYSILFFSLTSIWLYESSTNLSVMFALPPALSQFKT